MFHWAPYGQALFLVAIILTACSSYREHFGESDLKCLDCPLVEVTRIIDGDTFDSTTGTVRLFGVDTPERVQRVLPGGNGNVAEACWGCCKSAARSKDRGLLRPIALLRLHALWG